MSPKNKNVKSSKNNDVNNKNKKEAVRISPKELSSVPPVLLELISLHARSVGCHGVAAYHWYHIERWASPELRELIQFKKQTCVSYHDNPFKVLIPMNLKGILRKLKEKKVEEELKKQKKSKNRQQQSRKRTREELEQTTNKNGAASNEGSPSRKTQAGLSTASKANTAAAATTTTTPSATPAQSSSSPCQPESSFCTLPRLYRRLARTWAQDILDSPSVRRWDVILQPFDPSWCTKVSYPGFARSPDKYLVPRPLWTEFGRYRDQIVREGNMKQKQLEKQKVTTPEPAQQQQQQQQQGVEVTVADSTSGLSEFHRRFAAVWARDIIASGRNRRWRWILQQLPLPLELLSNTKFQKSPIDYLVPRMHQQAFRQYRDAIIQKLRKGEKIHMEEETEAPVQIPQEQQQEEDEDEEMKQPAPEVTDSLFQFQQQPQSNTNTNEEEEFALVTPTEKMETLIRPQEWQQENEEEEKEEEEEMKQPATEQMESPIKVRQQVQRQHQKQQPNEDLKEGAAQIFPSSTLPLLYQQLAKVWALDMVKFPGVRHWEQILKVFPVGLAEYRRKPRSFTKNSLQKVMQTLTSVYFPTFTTSKQEMPFFEEFRQYRDQCCERFREQWLQERPHPSNGLNKAAANKVCPEGQQQGGEEDKERKETNQQEWRQQPVERDDQRSDDSEAEGPVQAEIEHAVKMNAGEQSKQEPSGRQTARSHSAAHEPSTNSRSSKGSAAGDDPVQQPAAECTQQVESSILNQTCAAVLDRGVQAQDDDDDGMLGRHDGGINQEAMLPMQRSREVESADRSKRGNCEQAARIRSNNVDSNLPRVYRRLATEWAHNMVESPSVRDWKKILSKFPSLQRHQKKADFQQYPLQYLIPTEYQLEFRKLRSDMVETFNHEHGEHSDNSMNDQDDDDGEEEGDHSAKGTDKDQVRLPSVYKNLALSWAANMVDSPEGRDWNKILSDSPSFRHHLSNPKLPIMPLMTLVPKEYHIAFSLYRSNVFQDLKQEAISTLAATRRDAKTCRESDSVDSTTHGDYSLPDDLMELAEWMVHSKLETGKYCMDFVESRVCSLEILDAIQRRRNRRNSKALQYNPVTTLVSAAYQKQFVQYRNDLLESMSAPPVTPPPIQEVVVETVPADAGSVDLHGLSGEGGIGEPSAVCDRTGLGSSQRAAELAHPTGRIVGESGDEGSALESAPVPNDVSSYIAFARQFTSRSTERFYRFLDGANRISRDAVHFETTDRQTEESCDTSSRVVKRWLGYIDEEVTLVRIWKMETECYVDNMTIEPSLVGEVKVFVEQRSKLMEEFLARSKRDLGDGFGDMDVARLNKLLSKQGRRWIRFSLIVESLQDHHFKSCQAISVQRGSGLNPRQEMRGNEKWQVPVKL